MLGRRGVHPADDPPGQAGATATTPSLLILEEAKRGRRRRGEKTADGSERKPSDGRTCERGGDDYEMENQVRGFSLMRDVCVQVTGMRCGELHLLS